MASLLLDHGIVDTAIEYFKDRGILTEEHEDMDFADEGYPVPQAEYEAVQEIITCQVSLFCLRRLGRACGSNVDVMYDIIKRKIREYESNFGKVFVNTNQDLIW